MVRRSDECAVIVWKPFYVEKPDDSQRQKDDPPQRHLGLASGVHPFLRLIMRVAMRVRHFCRGVYGSSTYILV